MMNIQPRATFAAVVGDASSRSCTTVSFVTPSHAARGLGRQLGIVERSSAVDQPPGWIGFEDRVIAPERGPIGRVVPVGCRSIPSDASSELATLGVSGPW